MFVTSGDRAPTILIVEDDPDLSELYARWLNESFTIHVARDCATAYSMFHEPVTVALLDRTLPDGSGDELLTAIRELGLDWRTAMVTAEKPTIDILELDFDAYLQKPVSRSELRKTVSELVTRAEFRDVVVEFGRLNTKKSLVETYCTSTELDESDEYAVLQKRLEELHTRLVEMTSTFFDTECCDSVPP